jgi:hypothetical protein
MGSRVVSRELEWARWSLLPITGRVGKLPA